MTDIATLLCPFEEKKTRTALLASFENGRKLFSVNYTVTANEVLRISETVYLSDRCLGDKFVSTGLYAHGSEGETYSYSAILRIKFKRNKNSTR